METKEWKGFCDLHLHTTNSDGKYTPYELARLYMDKGIQTIAFTDHNVMLTKKEMNFRIITAICITRMRKPIHRIRMYRLHR